VNRVVRKLLRENKATAMLARNGSLELFSVDNKASSPTQDALRELVLKTAVKESSVQERVQLAWLWMHDRLLSDECQMCSAARGEALGAKYGWPSRTRPEFKNPVRTVAGPEAVWKRSVAGLRVQIVPGTGKAGRELGALPQGVLTKHGLDVWIDQPVNGNLGAKVRRSKFCLLLLTKDVLARAVKVELKHALNRDEPILLVHDAEPGKLSFAPCSELTYTAPSQALPFRTRSHEVSCFASGKFQRLGLAPAAGGIVSGLTTGGGVHRSLTIASVV
ncbi:Rab family GTPase, partial [Durusdinium trenchii]